MCCRHHSLREYTTTKPGKVSVALLGVATHSARSAPVVLPNNLIVNHHKPVQAHFQQNPKPVDVATRKRGRKTPSFSKSLERSDSMRIPFPSDISIGTDIIAFRRLLKPHASTTHLQRLAFRFMHPNEIIDLDQRFPDWRTFDKISPTQQLKLGAHLAGRWAAKEAAKKAWGASLISFKDLRIETLSDGQVQVVCQSYRDSRVVYQDRPGAGATLEQAAKLSISHDGDYAVATVIAAPLHAGIVADLIARKAEAAAKVRSIK